MHKVPIKCFKCGKKFDKIEEVRQHNRVDHLTTRIFHKSATNKSNEQYLKMNEDDRSWNDKNITCPYLCKAAPKPFLNTEEFESHILFYHSESKLFSCEQCEFTTAEKNLLMKHKEFEHKVIDNSREHQKIILPCNLCSYKAVHENDLRRHKNVMHKEPLKCYRCELEFMIKNDLLNHIKDYHKPSRNISRLIKPTANNQIVFN